MTTHSTRAPWMPLASVPVRGAVTLLSVERGPELLLLVAAHQVTPSLSGYDFVAARLRFRGVQSCGYWPPDCTRTAAFSVQPTAGGALRYRIAAREGDYAVVAAACTREELDAQELREARQTYAVLHRMDPADLFLPTALIYPSPSR
jgi:hypothetical protein